MRPRRVTSVSGAHTGIETGIVCHLWLQMTKSNPVTKNKCAFLQTTGKAACFGFGGSILTFTALKKTSWEIVGILLKWSYGKNTETLSLKQWALIKNTQWLHTYKRLNTSQTRKMCLNNVSSSGLSLIISKGFMLQMLDTSRTVVSR